MTKPIFVIRIPVKHKTHSEPITQTAKHLEKEYNVLYLFDELCDSFVFECYNGENINEIEFQDLKERLIMLMESALERKKVLDDEIYRKEKDKHKEDLKNKQELMRRLMNYQQLSQGTQGYSGIDDFNPPIDLFFTKTFKIKYEQDGK